MTWTLAVLAGFVMKHFLMDFLIQGPYMYLNKGIYGHLGGIAHAFTHGWSTFTLLMVCPSLTTSDAVLAGLIDMVVHYHIDWVKENLSTMFSWKDPKGKPFWLMLGFDQMLHMFTYIGIMAYFGIG